AAPRHLAQLGNGGDAGERLRVRGRSEAGRHPRDQDLAAELDAEGRALVLRARWVEVGEREERAPEAAQPDGVSVPPLLGRFAESPVIGPAVRGGVLDAELA